jgi:hypothetical protein
VLGLLTQYYYVFYAFFLCAACDVYLLAKRRWKDLAWFSCCALGGVAMFCLIYPACFDHLFAEKLVSGGSMLQQLMNFGDHFRRIHTYVYSINFYARVAVRAGVVAILACLPMPKRLLAQLRSGAVDANGYAPAGSDLASSATIKLGGYVSAIEVAVSNAQHLGAQGGDELRLAAIPSLSSSVSATAEKAGTAQLDCNVTALTVNGGKITSCYIDSLQAKVTFGADGVITGGISEAVETKNQLGERYGMVSWGGAIAEWNQQAASFAAYVTGKTAAEVAGIAITEGGTPANTDLASSVTIKIDAFQDLIAKALA